MTPISLSTAPSFESATEPPRAESIEDLFHALESPLLAYARRLSPHSDMAEDFVQDAFLRLQSQFDGVRAPRSWLYRTVHNLALNHRRDEAKVVSLTQPAETESGETTGETTDPRPLPDEQLARLEGIGLIRLNIKNLDARGQELLRLKFHEELSYQQISEQMGLTVSHVGYLLHHSLKALAADLARAGLLP